MHGSLQFSTVLYVGAVQPVFDIAKCVFNACILFSFFMFVPGVVIVEAIRNQSYAGDSIIIRHALLPLSDVRRILGATPFAPGHSQASALSRNCHLQHGAYKFHFLFAALRLNDVLVKFCFL